MPALNLTLNMFVITKIGHIPMQIMASYQQYTKEIIMLMMIQLYPTIYGAKLSVLTPLMIVVSWAIAQVNTLVSFSLSSNHPVFLLRIEAYKLFLTSDVTLSPSKPKENF